jgi:DNA polymerase type B, organellar and viral
MPAPFAAGFFDGTRYEQFWGDDAPAQLLAFLETQPPLIIYAHNGGRFDFLFLLENLINPIRIISGRVVEAKLGKHTLRDSFAILPVPLASYEKTEIDYEKFERECRDQHRAEILDYLRDDCINLFEVVRKFRDRFGDRLTIAGTAIKELASQASVIKNNQGHDSTFRQFYYGGRVECFEAGVLFGNFVVADVNSMYPAVMRNFPHPKGNKYELSTELRTERRDFFFAIIDASSYGALPVRTKTGIEFPSTRSTFAATSHEIRAGIETGTLEIHKCLCAWYAREIQDFGAFVDYWNAEKLSAEVEKDKAGRLFAKLIMNSAYGKFAQNPEEYHDYFIRRPASEPPPPATKGWEIYADHGDVEIWRKRAPIRPGSYYDVAVAASITGAARATLWRAICASQRVVYCDTDSIVCESPCVELDNSKLGAWKIEARGDRIAIAGKKTYALSNAGEFVKWASKGVELKPKIIVDVAMGKEIEYFRDAPSMTLKGFGFVNRTVRPTATQLRKE